MNTAIARAARAALVATIPLFAIQNAPAQAPFATLTLESSPCPYALAQGDFNADGVIDLACASGRDPFNDEPRQYSVYLGRGDGSFEPRLSFNAASTNVFLAGDFDGDGADELFARNPDDNGEDAFILLGVDANGDLVVERTENLSFVPFSASLRASGAAGDINGDGIDDIALQNGDGESLEIFLGFPGGFDQALIYTPEHRNGEIAAVTAQDINNDGAVELLTGHGRYVNAWAWNDGVQSEILFLEAESDVHGILPGELDGQPGVDLLLYTQVRYGLGGGLGPYVRIAYATYADVLDSEGPTLLEQQRDESDGGAVVLIDGDQDGLDDYLAAGGSPELAVNEVEYFPNDDGAFTQEFYNRRPHVGDTPTELLAADFNNDGRDDIAATNQEARTITILLGQGDHAFGGAVKPEGFRRLVAPRFLDINADGWIDLYDAERADVRFNDQGRFDFHSADPTPLTELGVASPEFLTDLDADADPDNISLDRDTGVVTVNINDAGLFTTQASYALPKPVAGRYRLSHEAVGSSVLAIYSPDRDGDQPVFRTAFVLTHLDAGDFAETVATSTYPGAEPRLTDVNNDGLPDLQWAVYDEEAVTVSYYEWINDAKGGFVIPAAPAFVTDRTSEYLSSQIDLNADGLPDRIVVEFEETPAGVVYSDRIETRQPDGTFTTLQTLETREERGVGQFSQTGAATSADFNADGINDLMLTHFTLDTTVSFQIYLGTPDAGYSNPIGLLSTRRFRTLGYDIADVDNDGDADFALGSNNSDPTPSLFTSGVLYNQTNNPLTSCRADFNNDGRVGPADLATFLPFWGVDEFPELLAAYDLDNDGAITSRDLAVILTNWGDCN